MSSPNKTIEKAWIKSFKKSALVDSATNLFSKPVAHVIFYGTEDGQQVNHPNNYNALHKRINSLSVEETLTQLSVFLNFIGIDLNTENAANYFAQYPNEFPNFSKKCYFILRTLAHKDEKTLNIENPFSDNYGDIQFLIRLHHGPQAAGSQLTIFEEQELPDFYSRFTELPPGYENNPIVQDLFKRVENSHSSFFITGKAGTGKSTFLHYFTRKTKKKAIVLAFTGIAAINVGGQTIHSFFLFPPDVLDIADERIPIFEQYSNKRKIIESIDVVIIDEVSMLRVDYLEAIDFSLRCNGGDPNKPFGGKQILLFGDIFQLPPITQEETDELERIVFSEIYDSKYFFDSPSFKALNPELFEFTVSYRQKSDTDFVNLLNNVRACENISQSINKLNERYQPNYSPRNEEFVMMLSANNYIANEVNKTKLKAIEEPTYKFEATIEGEFDEKRYPTNATLELKKNSQIIMLKNDPGQRRWVNGTIAKIHFIANDVLEIRLQDGTTHELQKEIWENRKTVRNSEGRLASKIAGRFIQYPIKLAWAITIHKSQGLTFDNVIIDMGTGAFINGQLYTALSRCRTLNGIILKNKLRPTDVIMDKRLFDYYNTRFLNTQ